ncbi:protein CDV3 homolog [Ceratina calcarata]|uniref:Protein CDV3 homolog n=1 Tax=Ceratina calcarata TaxID=156304 RepID=A0AAJ7NG45_9HYME|nr:protein CDV3 homolog [Ceratina calcarata]XP_017893454.1 protein CDV3 homolog [Ceratina calcarata]
MADLDDFFAKKDRKKAKGKKFTTTEEIAKKLEETGKRLVKKSKDKPLNPEGEETLQTEDEDEWREFEEEKKDYTGLKIGNLTVNESVDAESDDEKGTGDNSSDGESGEGGTKHSGPWKKPELAPQPEVIETAPPPLPPVTSSGSSYKPPHLRVQPSAPSPRPRAKNIAPDIHSEEYFPTLNTKQQQSNEPVGPWGRRKRDEGTFEEVRNRGGSRSYSVQDAQAQAPKLSLGNKYGALSQDQS